MKKDEGINAGSMADIAFLLLVFFLITTTMDIDYGIPSNIAKPFEIPDSIIVYQSTLLVNQSGDYLLNDKKASLETLSNDLYKEFKSDKYIKNVVLVKSDRDVPSEDFISALNESKKAFKIYHNELSQSKYGKAYEALEDSLKLELSLTHPVALAEDIVFN